MENQVRFPGRSHRITMIGRTGTGKTIAGLFHLSNYDLTAFPWVILNFKNDEKIDAINKATHLNRLDYVPGEKETGVFIAHPHPSDTESTLKGKSPVDTYLTRLWERGRVGVFVDECYPMGQHNDGFNLVLTQGRSLDMPMIIGTQQPVWISSFCFSEATFFQVFALNNVANKKRVVGFVPIEIDDFDTLKKHESFYYDVEEHALAKFRPVPPLREILEKIDDKLPRKKVVLI